jgi:hypothetical protein
MAPERQVVSTERSTSSHRKSLGYDISSIDHFVRETTEAFRNISSGRKSEARAVIVSPQWRVDHGGHPHHLSGGRARWALACGIATGEYRNDTARQTA